MNTELGQMGNKQEEEPTTEGEVFDPDGFTEDLLLEEPEEPEVKEPVAETAIEQKAKRMGWVEEDRFRGDKSRWVDAEKFVERGEEELPILRERLRKMDGTIVSLNNKIAGMRDTFGEFKEHQRKITASAYKKAMADIKAKQRAAAEEGDIETFDLVEKEKAELLDRYTEEQPKENDTARKRLSPEEEASYKEFDDWVSENKWYANDPTLKGYAQSLSVEIQKRDNIHGLDLYNAVKEDVMTRFPEKFKDRAAERTAVFGGGDYVPSSKTSGRSFKDLPKDAQMQCLKFIKEIPGYTKKEYVNDYEW